MKATVIISPVDSFPRKDELYYPVWALYIAGAFDEDYHEVEVFDMSNGFEKDKLKVDMESDICIMHVDSDYDKALDILDEIPDEIRTAVCGWYPTFYYDRIDKDLWDYILVGEPEIALPGIVSGIFHRGVIKCQPLHDLDGQRMPNRSLIDNSVYDFTTILASRGGLNSSKIPESYGRVRTRSGLSICKEMLESNYKFGYTHFVLINDTFASASGDIHNLCRYLKEYKRQLTWDVMVTPLMFPHDINLPREMYEAGCTRAFLCEQNKNLEERLRGVGIQPIIGYE